eukprot:Gb_40940 [translate_table: standard]
MLHCTAAADDIKDTSNGAQIADVQAWLSSMFEAAGKDVPEFEYTSGAVDHLNSVARISQARTQAALIVASDLREKAAEYRSQAARLGEILDGIGLASENLTQSAMASIKVLGTVANLLNIRNTETSSLEKNLSFLVGMGDLLLRKTDVEEKRSKAQKESDILLENIRKGITHLTHLKRTVAELEEEVGRREGIMQQRHTNLKIMDSKERQYLVQLANCKIPSFVEQTILSRVGYTPEINHGALIQMVENRRESERKTKPILNTLRTYQDLPPDKALAQLAIEDKRRECEAAEKYLEDVLHSALNTPSE